MNKINYNSIGKMKYNARMNELTLTKPDDFHIHLRDGDALYTTVPHCAARFSRALVMPNLVPPVVSINDAAKYRDRILAVIPEKHTFTPLMSLYLTDNTTVDMIKQAKASSFLYACKLYPAGATTNSKSGVTDINHIHDVLSTMEEVDLPLLIHGEVTDVNIDIFDREKVFLETVLTPLLERFPKLRIVLEHITTQDAVEFVSAQNHRLAATITAHHLWLNRNDLLVGGVHPHHYCLPVAKRDTHQQALIKAATSGSPKFFLGTDSAPHTKNRKESACGCAGIYTAHAAIELYAEIFERAGKLDALENFSSRFGAEFYQLPINEETITLKKQPWTVPNHYVLNGSPLIPFKSEESLTWQVI